jgi:hypothetical protein
LCIYPTKSEPILNKTKQLLRLQCSRNSIFCLLCKRAVIIKIQGVGSTLPKCILVKVLHHSHNNKKYQRNTKKELSQDKLSN